MRLWKVAERVAAGSVSASLGRSDVKSEKGVKPGKTRIKLLIYALTIGWEGVVLCIS